MSSGNNFPNLSNGFGLEQAGFSGSSARDLQGSSDQGPRPGAGCWSVSVGSPDDSWWGTWVKDGFLIVLVGLCVEERGVFFGYLLQSPRDHQALDAQESAYGAEYGDADAESGDIKGEAALAEQYTD